jgi:DNA-directed RNA polymerase specialized sigma24 family protein
MDDTALPPDPTAEFDAFYKAARDHLLLQTYALTGDLGAARSAVRDAFVVAWHHWRKVSRLDDPETSVRPHAWRHAARRATARPWHKEKGLDLESRATLDALASLSTPQRRALLLTQLAAVSMDDMAREIGLAIDVAERELQVAAAQFATHRDIPTASIPMAFRSLAIAIGHVTWPRVTIIRRAGAARRRMHTVVGAGAVVAMLVASGALVTDATGVRPTLDREPTAAPNAGPVAPGPEVVLPETSLLTIDSVRRTLAGDWQQGPTHDNSAGNGVVLPCQPGDAGARYADPRGRAAWVRVFRIGPTGEASRRFTEVVEASRTPERAGKTYHRLRGWVADCITPGFRLVGTLSTPGIADASAMFVLYDQHPEPATYVIGVARTGLFTTAVALQTDVTPERANRPGLAKLLGEAVDRICTLPDAGRCTGDETEFEAAPPFAAGQVPALLAPVDLPFVGDPAKPWMGTPPQEVTNARTDIDVLGCVHPVLADEYDGDRFRTDLVRTFVKVDSDLPAEFGLTQAVAALPKQAAGALLDDYRDAINDCPDRDASAGTEVRVLQAYDEGDDSFTAWHLSTRLPNERTIEYSVAFIRSGSAVSQLVFVSAPGARMSDAQFVALTERALARLPQLPPYQG